MTTTKEVRLVADCGEELQNEKSMLILGIVLLIVGVFMMFFVGPFVGMEIDEVFGGLIVLFGLFMFIAGLILVCVYAPKHDSLPDYGSYTGRIMSIEGDHVYLAIETDCGSQKLYEIDARRFSDLDDVHVMGSNARVVVLHPNCSDYEKMIDILAP
jgi:hypothetical protein